MAWTRATASAVAAISRHGLGNARHGASRRMTIGVVSTGPRRLVPTSILTNMPTRRNLVMVTKTSSSSSPVFEENLAKTTRTTSQPSNDSPQTSSSNSSPVVVTPSAIKRIRALAQKRQLGLDQVYLRVYVDAGGCSGFQYKFELTLDANEPVHETDDVVVTADNDDNTTTTPARVVVDTASLAMLQGSTIDFVQDMIKSSFSVLSNPQSESACGCGSSFAVKNFESNPALD